LNDQGPRTLTVQIARTDPSARRTFSVDVVEPALVLDALLAVQRVEPSLAFRFSCRVAMCGTCAVRIDGRPALACQTRIPSDAFLLEPLAGLPVVRDLIVDPTPFWDAWRRVTPWFVPAADGAAPPLAAGDPQRAEVESGLDCIACGACWAGCDIAGSQPGYLGPAALNRAMTLVADPRDGAAPERLQAVSKSDGVTRCHSIGGCTGACPKGLDPAASIRRLRRRSFRAA
jgi:succinate dehydrogenase/fumarate reductase iron-sulfur protein